MYLLGLLYWLSVIGVALIGTLVLIRQRKAPYYFFAAFTYGLSLWLICQFFVGKQGSDLQFWLGVGFLALEVVAPAFLGFIYLFVGHKIHKVAGTIILLLPLLLFAPMSFTDLLLKTSYTDAGVQFTLLPLYFIQSALILLYVLAALIILIRAYISGSENDRASIKFFFWAFVPFLLAVILTGIVFPNVNSIQFLRPLGALVMVGALAYAIAFKKLFDIRLVVVRALVYTLTLTSVGFIYGFFAFGIVGRILFDGQSFSIQQQVVYTILAVILAFTFQPIERFFNRFTNRIFYRDAYDSQVLLNRLSNVFSSEIDIKKVIDQSSQIIAEELKLTHAVILVNDERGNFRSATYGRAPDLSDIKRSYLEQLSRKVTIVDNDDKLKNKSYFQDHNISLVVRLVTQDGVVGYLVMGQKQSGNVFNSQDTSVMTIISNNLAVAIQNTLLVERIQMFNITLQQKVDDATRKLRRTNEKLKALDETKDDFISMASHQLRTPLTSIKGYLSMVVEGDAGKITNTQKEMLTQAYFSSQRMVYLISDLLNVSRLKTGKFVIEPTRVNLATMVEQEMNQLKEAAEARNLSLSFDRPEEFPDVMLDETKTRQVVMNFADNAIYYTPAGGHVRLRLIDTPTTVEFRVEDNGIGVARSDQPHLFTKFYRAGNARKARPDGTGLGLFMAKKVIMAEEGSIIFTSEEGKGSTFGFVFSKAKVLAPPKTPAKPTKEKALAK